MKCWNVFREQGDTISNLGDISRPEQDEVIPLLHLQEWCHQYQASPCMHMFKVRSETLTHYFCFFSRQVKYLPNHIVMCSFNLAAMVIPVFREDGRVSRYCPNPPTRAVQRKICAKITAAFCVTRSVPSVFGCQNRNDSAQLRSKGSRLVVLTNTPAIINASTQQRVERNHEGTLDWQHGTE